MTAKIIPFPKRVPQPSSREEAAAALEAAMRRHPCNGLKLSSITESPEASVVVRE